MIVQDYMNEIQRSAEHAAEAEFRRETRRILGELIDRVKIAEAQRGMTFLELSNFIGYMKSGQKIQAIKLVRDVYSMGLREAKDFVDAHYTHWHSTLDRLSDEVK